jgi:hypothetical protein
VSLYAVPAQAANDDLANGATTLNITIQTDDPSRYYGIDLSNGGPVVKVEMRHDWKRFSLSIDGSVGLSEERGYADRRPSNRFSVGGEYTDAVRIGKLGLLVHTGVRYRGNNYRPRPSTIDDEVWIYAGVGVPIALSSWTVEPYYRRSGSIPVVRNNRLAWHEWGAQVNGNLGHGYQLNLGLSNTKVDASITATPQREIASLDVSVSKMLRNKTRLTVGGELFTPMKDNAQSDQFIARDGKFMQHPDRRQEWGDKTTVTWRVGISRRL